MERLETYLASLVEWQAKINLISRDTLSDIWRRHFLDSAQLANLLPTDGPLLDLGSGAGFPGLVLAILSGRATTLVESDQRKAVFLRHVSRETNADATVMNARIEACPFPPARIITARALARLDRLLVLCERFMTPETVLLLPKGRSAEQELTLAGESWTMRVERFPSLTDEEATIFRLSEVQRA